MKQGVAFLIAALLLEIYSINTVNGQVTGETGMNVSRSIPVYSGAVLLTKNKSGEEPSCCDFSTKDALEKVILFYESALKNKALDATALAARYPAMKSQIDMMCTQMPPQMKIKFFVLQEVSFQGKKGAELFELISDPSGVHFTITESRFLPKDKHFATDWQDALTQASGTTKPKTIDPSLLKNALPSASPAGFEKGEVNTENSSQPSINVLYSKLVKKGTGGEDGSANVYNTINVTITDEAGNMEFASSMIKAEGQGEKPVKVKGRYDGKEKVEKNDYGCVGAEITFLVNNRYLVELRTAGICDLDIINHFIDSMKFENL